MPARSPKQWVIAPWLFVLTQCTAPGLGQGVAHYENARFAEAWLAFERLEAGAPRMSRSDWARYGLYRGLTELALGNASAAHTWLLRTQLALDRRPALLGQGDRARLSAAWRSLGLLPAQR